MPNWKKVIVSGSDASLNSLNVTAGVTGSFTGSLTGTATSASFASTASYVNPLNQNVLITGSLTVSSSNANQFQVGSNLLYVGNNGNVGIGTTSPAYKLNVSADIGCVNLFTTGGSDRKSTRLNSSHSSVSRMPSSA